LPDPGTNATAGSRESSRLAKRSFGSHWQFRSFPTVHKNLRCEKIQLVSSQYPTSYRSSTRFSFPYQTDNEQGQGWPLPVIDECMDRAPAFASCLGLRTSPSRLNEEAVPGSPNLCVLAVGGRTSCVFRENMDSRTVAQRGGFTGNHGLFPKILPEA